MVERGTATAAADPPREARADGIEMHALRDDPSRIEPVGDEPPLDPEAIDRAYRLHRARRNARDERRRELRRAGARFWFVVLLLLAASLALAVFIVQQVQQLFGV